VLGVKPLTAEARVPPAGAGELDYMQQHLALQQAQRQGQDVAALLGSQQAAALHPQQHESIDFLRKQLQQKLSQSPAPVYQLQQQQLLQQQHQLATNGVLPQQEQLQQQAHELAPFPLAHSQLPPLGQRPGLQPQPQQQHLDQQQTLQQQLQQQLQQPLQPLPQPRPSSARPRPNERLVDLRRMVANYQQVRSRCCRRYRCCCRADGKVLLHWLPIEHRPALFLRPRPRART
jgi:hypothetical protein